MRSRLQVVGVVVAMLIGLVMPVALAQSDEGPRWWKCDERGRCLFERPIHPALPMLDEEAVDQMNARAAELAAALEAAGIEHDVVTLDVVTWDHSDPEANRVVGEFWGRMLPPVPGEGFIPWPLPDRGETLLEFEGIWPDDILPLLEEWLGDGFGLGGFPLFGDRPGRERPSWWVPGEGWGDDGPPELFDEQGRPLEFDSEDVQGSLDRFLGDLAAHLEDLLGSEDGLLARIEELIGGGGGLVARLEDLLGSEDGLLARIEELIGGEDGLDDRLEELFGEEGELGAFLDEYVGGDNGYFEGLLEWFDDAATGSDDAAGDEAPSSGLPDWDWPFDGGST